MGLYELWTHLPKLWLSRNTTPSFNCWCCKIRELSPNKQLSPCWCSSRPQWDFASTAPVSTFHKLLCAISFPSCLWRPKRTQNPVKKTYNKNRGFVEKQREWDGYISKRLIVAPRCKSPDLNTCIACDYSLGRPLKNESTELPLPSAEIRHKHKSILLMFLPPAAFSSLVRFEALKYFMAPSMQSERSSELVVSNNILFYTYKKWLHGSGSHTFIWVKLCWP